MKNQPTEPMENLIPDTDELAVCLQRMCPGAKCVRRFAALGGDAEVVEGGQYVAGHMFVPLADSVPRVVDGSAVGERDCRPGVGYSASADLPFDWLELSLPCGSGCPFVPRLVRVPPTERHLTMWTPDPDDSLAVSARTCEHVVQYCSVGRHRRRSTSYHVHRSLLRERPI